MESNISKAVDDDDDGVQVFAKDPRPRVLAKGTDQFDLGEDAIRGLRGMSPQFKRKANNQMEKFHRGRAGAGSKKKEQQTTFTTYNLFGTMLPPYNLDYLAKLNEINPTHYAAVKAKVANIVGLGYDFVESHKTKEKMSTLKGDALEKYQRKIQRDKRTLYEWLDSLHQEDEFIETLQKVWTDYETTGNGYIEIGRSIDGGIGYLGHIPASTMRVRQARDGFVQIVNNEVTFFRHFGDKTTRNPIGPDQEPNEVIHFKKYSPTDTYYGVPDIVAAKNALAGNEFAARFNLDYFENKAVPRYVIVIKNSNMSDRNQQKLIDFLDSGLKGQNHRTLVVPLPADTTEKKVEFEMNPVEAGVQDSSFPNYREGNIDDILTAHRVPRTKVSIMAKGISLAMARDADKTFKEQVCRPEQRIAEKKLNKVISELTNMFTLKLNELTLTDEDTMSKIDERYLRMKTILPNEIRARWGWTGIEGGDKPVEMKPEQAKEQTAQARQSRTRDANRSANAPDNDGEARQPKGAGRAVS